jgi:predicted XRE-type DNA-binding protein
MWCTTTTRKEIVTYRDHIGYTNHQHLQQHNQAKIFHQQRKDFRAFIKYKFKINTIKKLKATLKHKMS